MLAPSLVACLVGVEGLVVGVAQRSSCAPLSRRRKATTRRPAPSQLWCRACRRSRRLWASAAAGRLQGRRYLRQGCRATAWHSETRREKLCCILVTARQVQTHSTGPPRGTPFSANPSMDLLVLPVAPCQKRFGDIDFDYVQRLGPFLGHPGQFFEQEHHFNPLLAGGGEL